MMEDGLAKAKQRLRNMRLMLFEARIWLYRECLTMKEIC